MDYYQKELQRIRSQCFSRESQLAAVIAIRKYMDQHLDSGMSLDTLSRIGCVSKFHMLRLFKKYYGMTPHQYLIDKRIERSKAYLKNGMAVTHTCYSIGFESPASFSTLFRKKTGYSPEEFQNKQFSKSQSPCH